MILPKGLTWAKVKTKFKDSPWGQNKPNPQSTASVSESVTKTTKTVAFNQEALESILSEWDHEITMDKSSATVRVELPNKHTVLGRYSLKGKFDIQKFGEICRAEASVNDNIETLRILVWKSKFEALGDKYNHFKKIVLAPEIKTIAPKAFQNYESLNCVVMPDGLTTIGKGAFMNCKSLTSLDLPESVIHIECPAYNEYPSAFEHSGITALENKKYLVKDGMFIDKETKILLEVLDCAPSEVIVPDGIINIGQSAFYKSSAKGVKLHDGIQKIALGAFNGSLLEAIEIPGSVSVINYRTFAECHNLKSATLHEGLTEILQSAFYDCTALTSIVIPESVQLISDTAGGAFEKCTSLESVTIKGTPLIRENAFKGTPWRKTSEAKKYFKDI